MALLRVKPVVLPYPLQALVFLLRTPPGLILLAAVVAVVVHIEHIVKTSLGRVAAAVLVAVSVMVHIDETIHTTG
jgi:ABC-type methionine transport system permease subunit